MKTLRPAASLLAISLVVLAARAQDPPPAPAQPPAAPPQATGLAPAAVAAELAPLSKDRLFRDAEVAVHVANVRTGEEVYAVEGDRRLNPASTMKVLTAAAALRALGPSYRFTTDVYTDGEIDAKGVLDGNLYVQGHGDPTFVVEKLWRMVYDLRMEGVREIGGDVVYDESFLTTDYAIDGWDKPEDLEKGPSYFAPVGALSLNYNTVAIVVGPGEEVGSPARVELETPAGAYVAIENRVTTGAVKSWTVLDIDRAIEPVEGSDRETMTFTVTGSFPSGGEVRRYYRSVSDPTAQFMGAFAEMLEAQGIEVEGDHVRGTTPARADRLAQSRSPTLGAVLMDMNKYSNNFIAELVIRTVGAELYGTPGTTAKGVTVVSDYLVSLGFEPGAFTVVNGSGLTRDTFVTPRMLTAVMVDMAHDPIVGHEFVASLSIAGYDGTLWRRLRDEAGKVRGKTGTIDGVHCLTAYVQGGDGDLYAFAVLVNDIRGSVSKARDLHDKLSRGLLSLEAYQPEVVDVPDPAGQ